jgi:hypothetical protein
MSDFDRFKPKRSAARWLYQAPEYVVACYDNRGRSADRYTVLFGGSLWEPDYAKANASCGRDPRLVQCLAMSGSPEHPQGVSIWTDCLRGAHLGRKVKWLDLPEHIREHVTARAARTLEPI